MLQMKLLPCIKQDGLG